MEFLAERPFKLIVAELPGGGVILTQVDTITQERHSITLPPVAAYAAALAIRFASHQGLMGVYVERSSISL